MFGELLCRIGLHRWAFDCVVDHQRRVVTDYSWCKRQTCRFRKPMMVNKEPFHPEAPDVRASFNV